MRAFILLLIVIAMGAAVFLHKRSEIELMPAPSAVVLITDEGFVPTSTVISAGEVVTFKNGSSREVWPAVDLHPTHELYPGFDPKRPLAAGEEWNFRLDKKGTWPFHDHLHPNKRGLITVQ